MAYVALYRKYRSQTFGELMGQDHVTRTLQNALKSGHISQAYLFHGARGCGKTSTARLIARALNCVATDKPNPEPCGVCALCVSIREGTCLDVVEIDAASETGVDNVREKVIENVQYAPAEARYKVYIIDEVHDLSAKAFDALLKTIEEPPPHVVFVLATTEYHKVPITIRSRCQQYQFKRGTLTDLASAIQRVVDGEGYTAETDAVLAVARAAEGSWRDALSLLEQVMAYGDEEKAITSETVQRAIGTVGTGTLEIVTEALAQNDASTTLDRATELIDSGTDVRQLLTAMSGHLRDLLILSSGAKQMAATEMGAEKVARLAPQAALYSPDLLLKMLETLAAAEKEIRFTNQHRWLLERTLLKLMPVNLERSLVQSGAQVSSQVAQTRPPVTSPVVSQAPSRVPDPTRVAEGTPQVIPRPETRVEAPTFAPLISPEEEMEEEEAEEEGQSEEDNSSVTPTPTVAPSISAPDEAEPDHSRFAEAVTLEVVQRSWKRILKLFEKASPGGAPFLAKGQVIDLQKKVVILGFPASEAFAMNRIQNNAKGKSLVEEKVNEGLNTNGYTIRCQTLDSGSGGNENGGIAPARPLTPSPPPSSTEETMMSMLDVPVEEKPLAKTGGGFGDFVLPIAEPPSPSANTASVSNTPAPNPVQKAVTPSSPPPSKPAPISLLKEALDLMGGSVIKSEPL